MKNKVGMDERETSNGLFSHTQDRRSLTLKKNVMLQANVLGTVHSFVNEVKSILISRLLSKITLPGIQESKVPLTAEFYYDPHSNFTAECMKDSSLLLSEREEAG